MGDSDSVDHAGRAGRRDPVEPEIEPEPAAKRARICAKSESPEPDREPEPWGGTAEEENSAFSDDLLFQLHMLQ